MNKCEFLRRKVTFYIITAGVIFFSIVLEMFRFFAWWSECKNKSSISEQCYNAIQAVENYTYYTYSYNAFGKSDTFYCLRVAKSLFRDLLVAVVLLVFNIPILVEMKKVTRRRIRLFAQGRSSQHRPTSNPIQQGTGSDLATSEFVQISMRAQKRKSIILSSPL
jgi:hypothetical protein